MREDTEALTEETEEGEAPSRLLRTVLPLLVVGGLLLAHLEMLNRGPGYAGPLLLLDHLFDLMLAVGAMGLFVASGRRFLRQVGLEPAHPADVLLYAAAVGPGLWGLLFLILGFSGALSGLSLAIAVLVGAVLVRDDLSALPALVGRVASGIWKGVGRAWLLVLGSLVLVLVALFLFLHGSAPPGDWDSLMYHLQVPSEWLASGGIHLPEGNLHAAFVSLLQLLYLPFLAVGSEAGPALLNGIFALLLALTVYRLGEQLFDVETGFFSSVLLWTATGLLFVAITARVDTTLAFFLLLGQGAVALALVDRKDSRDHLIRAALVLGLAAGAKYHALAYTAAVAPVGAWALWKAAGAGRDRVRLFAILSGVFLVAMGPWALKNWVLLGDPLYPFLGGRVLPSWLADLYGTSDAITATGLEAAGVLGEARQGFDLFDLFWAPERLTVEPEAVHYHLSPLLLFLLPLGVLHWKRSGVLLLAGPALLYGVGVVIGLGTINLRYLFPAIAPLTLVTTFFAVDGLGRLASPRARRIVLAVASVLLLIPTARSMYEWTRQFPVVRQALGGMSRQAYLEEGYGFYAGLAGTVNSEVPREGKVLLIWEARGFYLAPAVLPDNVLTNWPLLSPYVEETGGCLEDTGITHVMASTSAARYYESRGADPVRLDLDGFASFADRCLKPVRVGPAFGLYRVPRAAAVSTTLAGG